MNPAKKDHSNSAGMEVVEGPVADQEAKEGLQATGSGFKIYRKKYFLSQSVYCSRGFVLISLGEGLGVRPFIFLERNGMFHFFFRPAFALK